MSTLYLIRHGQASFGAADYDVLSERGVAQSRRLGAHWAARDHRLDACYTGPRRRQIDTADHLLAGARDAGRDYPAPALTIDELDEYPAFGLLNRWMPTLTAEDPSFRDLMDVSAAGGVQRLRRAFTTMTAKWARGELDTGDLETFDAFADRVRRGLRQIMTEQGRGKRVAVCTSGGPISIAMQLALGLTAEKALEIAWVVANASVSEFRWRDPDDFALVAFNTTPHIHDPALLTYR